MDYLIVVRAVQTITLHKLQLIDSQSISQLLKQSCTAPSVRSGPTLPLNTLYLKHQWTHQDYFKELVAMVSIAKNSSGFVQDHFNKHYDNSNKVSCKKYLVHVFFYSQSSNACYTKRRSLQTKSVQRFVHWSNCFVFLIALLEHVLLKMLHSWKC